MELEDTASISPLSAALPQSQPAVASSSQPAASQQPPSSHSAGSHPSLAAADASAAADRAGQQSSSAGPAGPSCTPSQQLSFSQDGPNLPHWAWQDPSLLWLPVAVGELSTFWLQLLLAALIHLACLQSAGLGPFKSIFPSGLPPKLQCRCVAIYAAGSRYVHVVACMLPVAISTIFGPFWPRAADLGARGQAAPSWAMISTQR